MVATEQKVSVNSTTDTPHRGLPAPVRVLLVLLVLATIGTLVWYFLIRKPPLPAGVIAVSGRIEGDVSSVAPKVAGKLLEILVREGDTVTAGQLIATLDAAQVQSRRDAAQFAVTQAEARVTRAQQQIAVLEAQRQQSWLGIDQAKTDAAGRVQQAESNVATAEAALAQAEASYELAKWDVERFESLAADGIEPERSAKQARSAEQAQAAAVRAAHKQVDAARAALETARGNLANPAIRTAQTTAIEQQIVQARSDIAAAEADADRSKSQLKEADENLNDLRIVAPFDGTIATRAAEPGEVIAAGTPIVTLVDMTKVYLRAFVPEGQIGRVVVGQKARVYLDSSQKTALDAEVERIDPEASFTPENTYFKDDRVKQVVGVKLALRQGFGNAKPGMPADGEILVEGSDWPAGARR
ncbi:MAG TPA: HlyD family efflux transporter periplasmic adaptor subunit [Blastocatellia bacterium]|nr:HlyD family efflux transporter periplasmic adaptor subunit [Blastocatellia bacterium]